MFVLDGENQPDWGDPEGAAAAQCGRGWGNRHPDRGGCQSYCRSAGAAGGQRATGQNHWTNPGQGQSIRQHYVSDYKEAHLFDVLYFSPSHCQHCINMMKTGKNISIWFYVFYIWRVYTHNWWLCLMDLLLPTSVLVFFSLLIKSCLSCLQMSGSEKQEERILILQNDLKTSIVVSRTVKLWKLMFH